MNEGSIKIEEKLFELEKYGTIHKKNYFKYF